MLGLQVVHHWQEVPESYEMREAPESHKMREAPEGYEMHMYHKLDAGSTVEVRWWDFRTARLTVELRWWEERGSTTPICVLPKHIVTTIMLQIPLTSSVPVRATLPWDAKLWSEFEDVPKNATDESLWYGPWDTVLHRLFRDNEGFQIALQHLKMGNRGEPEWSVFYLVKAGSFPMCIIKVKPLWHLKWPQRCMSGDTPSHTSTVPDSTPPLGWNSALLHFSNWNSTLLPFLNSTLPSSWSSIPLSLLEILWMWNNSCMYIQGWLEVHIVQGQCTLSNGPDHSWA